MGIISEPMIAAWLEPRPGKNEQIGEMKRVVRVGPIKSFLFILSFSIFCSGTIVLDFIEYIIVDVPKSPVRSGRRGCSTLRFSVASPRNPAMTKIKTAFVLDSFSL